MRREILVGSSSTSPASNVKHGVRNGLAQLKNWAIAILSITAVVGIAIATVVAGVMLAGMILLGIVAVVLVAYISYLFRRPRPAK